MVCAIPSAPNMVFRAVLLSSQISIEIQQSYKVLLHSTGLYLLIFANSIPLQIPKNRIEFYKKGATKIV